MGGQQLSCPPIAAEQPRGQPPHRQRGTSWRRVADPADVLAGQGAPPDPGVPPLPPLPIAAIPLPDGMAAPLGSPRLEQCRLGCLVRLAPCV